MIEHLSRNDGDRFLRECFRVLEPRGVIRLSTPDAERFLRSYAGDGEFLRHPAFPDPIETPLDRVNLMMRENGQHLWVYDRESLSLALKRAGFSSAIEQKFGESTHPRLRNLDTPERAFESLYVEGIK
jgi:predicted SAM-dependent methyltransferase